VPLELANLELGSLNSSRGHFGHGGSAVKDTGQRAEQCLVVGPRRSSDQPWPARSAGRSIQIESYAHASNLAIRNGLVLRIAHVAWLQMTTAGLAPHALPADVELV
jgi:hypothetical protein